jgi:hypothetical protein
MSGIGLTAEDTEDAEGKATGWILCVLSTLCG